MLGNWARCTTTTTGTGNLTLSSVSNYPTINDSVGLVVRFYYCILDDSTGDPIEAGVGYLSGSTTLVREKILATYVSSTFDQTSPSAVSLAAGTKRVIVAAIMQSSNPALPIVGNSFGAKYLGNGATRADLTAGTFDAMNLDGRLNAFPWYHDYGGEVDAFVCLVNTAQASKIARIGLYTVSMTTGTPETLIVESGSIDIASTGVKVSTFTARVIPPGWYVIAVLSNSTTATIIGSSANAQTCFPNSAPWGAQADMVTGAGCYSLSNPTTAMPGTCPAMTYTANLKVPQIMFRCV
jgi:hypothetical protein